MQRPYDKNLQNSWYKAYLVDTGVLETAEKGNGYMINTTMHITTAAQARFILKIRQKLLIMQNL